MPELHLVYRLVRVDVGREVHLQQLVALLPIDARLELDPAAAALQADHLRHFRVVKPARQAQLGHQWATPEHLQRAVVLQFHRSIFGHAVQIPGIPDIRHVLVHA